MVWSRNYLKSKPPETIRNDSKASKTTRNHPKPPTTTQNFLQPTTNYPELEISYDHPQTARTLSPNN